MANLIDWIEVATKNETIIACIIGVKGWADESDSAPKRIILTWEQAKPYLNYNFDDGYGAPGCHAIFVYTENYIYFVSQYDGSTYLCHIPRNPTVGFMPYMPGG